VPQSETSFTHLAMSSTAGRYTLTCVHARCAVLLYICALVLVLWLQQFAQSTRALAAVYNYPTRSVGSQSLSSLLCAECAVALTSPYEGIHRLLCLPDLLLSQCVAFRAPRACTSPPCTPKAMAPRCKDRAVRGKTRKSGKAGRSMHHAMSHALHTHSSHSVCISCNYVIRFWCMYFIGHRRPRSKGGWRGIGWERRPRILLHLLCCTLAFCSLCPPGQDQSGQEQAYLEGDVI